MGQSTNGQISFGVLLGAEEDLQGILPWLKDEDGEGDFDDWWFEVACGFKPVSQYPYDENGNYLPGMGRDHPAVKAYSAERYAFQKANPCPFELVNFCSADVPMYILAVKGVGDTALRGHPTQFDPKSAFLLQEGAASSLVDFCKKHGIEFQGDPAWWLSSYWG